MHLFFSLDTDGTNHSQPEPEKKTTQCNQNQSGTKMYSDNQTVPLLVENENFMRSDTEIKSSVDVTQKSRNNRVRRGMMAGPIATTTQVTYCWLPYLNEAIHCLNGLLAQHKLFFYFSHRIHTKEDTLERLRFPSRCSGEMTKAGSPWRGCRWLA